MAKLPTLFLKPAAGLLVRDPETRKPLPPEGAEVADATFWHRRLADGDVTAAQAPPEPALKAASKAAPGQVESAITNDRSAP